MRSPLSYHSDMRCRSISRKLLFPADFQLPPRSPLPTGNAKLDPETAYEAWLASRRIPGQNGSYLVPGAPRPLTLENARLALFVTQTCTLDFVSGTYCSGFQLEIKTYFWLIAENSLGTQPPEDDTYDGPEHCQKPFPSIPRLLPSSSVFFSFVS